MTENLNRRPEKALTAQVVRNASEPGKYFDGHGLFLKVNEGGGKSWVQRIVIRGKRRELGLGSAQLVSLAEARGAALHNRKVARAGGDPLATKREAANAPTFQQAAERAIAQHATSWQSERHGAIQLSLIKRYAFPVIGDLKLKDITTADILRVLSPIWTEKPETARRLRQRLGMVMKWAIAQGERADNPVDNVGLALPKVKRAPEHRKALPYSEVQKCLGAVHGSGALASTKLALEFLVLTAARSGEVRLATWGEIDFEKQIWEISAARMKMRRSHRVPLSSRAIEILQLALAQSGGVGMIFPGTKQGIALSDMTLSKLVKELGFDADVHGFRTSFRTWVQECTDFPREVAEAALAHLSGDAVERAYARSDVFEKRRTMMDAWAAYVAGGKPGVKDFAKG
ncbi:tyrosine-type recombinase/integrase [Cypionkella sp.]|uniref:tyrosine-type recombinase/integrase n=1 Tax=Cypionkella sp. TaxID=2811411 RepID=UPI003753B4F2